MCVYVLDQPVICKLTGPNFLYKPFGVGPLGDLLHNIFSILKLACVRVKEAN